MNQFDTTIVLNYTTEGEGSLETFHATGTVGGIREFCDWLDGCLVDLADTAFMS